MKKDFSRLADCELLEIADNFLQNEIIKKGFDELAKDIVKRGLYRHSDIWSEIYDWLDAEVEKTPERIQTALTEHIETYYLHKKEECVWICVYKDTIKSHFDSDNLAHVRVLKSFAERWFEEKFKPSDDCEWKSFDDFFVNYTADDTEGFYAYAKQRDAVYGLDIPEEPARTRNFMLISVRERIMTYSYYDTLEDAKQQMWNEALKSCDSLAEAIENEMAEVNEMSAWITDGNNHDDYDWWIVDQRKSVYELLNNTLCDFDTVDTHFDASVTVCYIEEGDNDAYERFCLELYKKAKNVSFDGKNVTVDWNALIRTNEKSFRDFTEKHWEEKYPDTDDFVYQWIRELDLMLAGRVDDETYEELAEMMQKLNQVDRRITACYNTRIKQRT